MKKLIIALTLNICISSAAQAYTDDCINISNIYIGKWTYTTEGMPHTIEFTKDSKEVLIDGKRQQMQLCASNNKFLKSDSFISHLDRYELSKLESDDYQIKIGFINKSKLVKAGAEEATVSDNSRLENTVNEFDWKVATDLDGHMYPSMILSTATWSVDKLPPENSNKPKKFEKLGYPFGPLFVAINNVEPNTHVKIEVDMGELAENSVFEGELTKANTPYVIRPKINYNFQKWLDIKQPIPQNIKFTLYVNGEKFGEKYNTATIHSINDALTSYTNPDGTVTSTSFVFGAYVNENNPNIDVILREAFNSGVINRFIGYQGGEQEVKNQVFAIWNALQRRGIRYSSITTPTAISKNANSQYVRFFDDSLNNSQANCVDGTVLFASILRRIGINPKLVLIPGHMFLGFDLDPYGKKIDFLETTMIGSTDLGANKQNIDDKLSKILKLASKKNIDSYNSFVAANTQGEREAAKVWSLLQTNADPQYQMIDIQQLRAAGFASINH